MDGSIADILASIGHKKNWEDSQAIRELKQQVRRVHPGQDNTGRWSKAEHG
jgi:hypothetical protein